jgi:hypothetical protein|tara:strand:- start:118 stop:855 length:738 start_codon:yes stop_codon:yes gene_type:complete
MAELKFPTEVVDLPSKGYFYVEGHPLSKGKVEVKYMTAKEEDILTSQNLIKQGTVIDTLLQSLIVDKTINVNELLIGDKNAIMVAARILGYGKDYQFTYNGEEQSVDLSKLEPVDIDFSKFTKGVNEFSFKLPNSKRQINYKLLSGKDEKEVEAEIKSLQKVTKDRSSELTTRLKKIILSVDGNSDRTYVNSFIDNEFLSRDSLEFRKHLVSMTPDIDMSANIDVDGEEQEVTIPVTLRFFWPET